MIAVSKTIYKEMKELKLLKDGKHDRNYIVANRYKKSKQKTFLIQEDIYLDFIKTIG